MVYAFTDTVIFTRITVLSIFLWNVKYLKVFIEVLISYILK